jgi:hypothetical protein
MSNPSPLTRLDECEATRDGREGAIADGILDHGGTTFGRILTRYY